MLHIIAAVVQLILAAGRDFACWPLGGSVALLFDGLSSFSEAAGFVLSRSAVYLSPTGAHSLGASAADAFMPPQPLCGLVLCAGAPRLGSHQRCCDRPHAALLTLRVTLSCPFTLGAPPAALLLCPYARLRMTRASGWRSRVSVRGWALAPSTSLDAKRGSNAQAWSRHYRPLTTLYRRLSSAPSLHLAPPLNARCVALITLFSLVWPPIGSSLVPPP